MTREEIIHHIRYSIDINADIILTNDEGEEFIKALEQEPCEDCVSRKAVINEIKSMSNVNPSYWNECDVVDREDLIDSIQDLPSVTPTRKTGRWKRMSDLQIEQDDRWECSRCGNVIHCKSRMNLITFFGWDARCGAKMIEADKE